MGFLRLRSALLACWLSIHLPYANASKEHGKRWYLKFQNRFFFDPADQQKGFL
jgi:hypothetical protein